MESRSPQSLVNFPHALKFYDGLRHVKPRGTDVYRDSYTRTACDDILYSEVAFHRTWAIVKKSLSFSFRDFPSLTFTLALLQVSHPDLTFLCGRLIRKVYIGISTSSTTNSFAIVFIHDLVCRSGNRVANEAISSPLQNIYILSDDAQDLIFGFAYTAESAVAM